MSGADRSSIEATTRDRRGIWSYDALGVFAGLSFVMAGVVATLSIALLSFQPRGEGPERGVPIVGNSARPNPGE